MLKRLVVIGLFAVGLYPAWTQVPWDGGHQNQKTQGSQDQSNTFHPSLARIDTQVRAAEKKKNSDRQPSPYPWRELYGPANLPNWLLAIVGACGVVAAVKTLGIMNRQTNLLREQLDRMVERERARLNLLVHGIETQEPRIPWVALLSCVELTNGGHSNAYIRFSAARLLICKAGQWPLPTPDPDGISTFSDTIEPSQSPVYAPVEIEDESLYLDEFTRKVKNGDLGIYLYGFIEYETMGIGWHRDFAYKWTPADQSVIIMRHEGKEVLIGDWEQDVRQKNTEYRITPN